MVVHGTSKSIFRLKNGIDHAPIPPISGEAVFAGVFALRRKKTLGRRVLPMVDDLIKDRGRY
jgi:hypothetical protein